MIPVTDLGWQGQSWQELLQNAVTDINELVSLLDLRVPRVTTPFPLRVPLPYLARIERGNPKDPLLRQVLPSLAERDSEPGYSFDPLAEQGQSPVPGMLHKYNGRVLVITSGACAVNCRYCFRRHFPYDGFQPDTAAWDQIFDHVRRTPSVSEVILSGGDPLVQSDKRLAWISDNLASSGHVDTLRIHTRVPIVIPNRVGDSLLAWIRETRLKVVMVLHSNHANELDASVQNSANRLRDAGVTLLNQSVLLRGVNDSVEALTGLSRRLFGIGVLPYYLHLLDKVTGAHHFDVPEEEARALMRGVADVLPGYLVPRLVREAPGATAKVTLHW